MATYSRFLYTLKLDGKPRDAYEYAVQWNSFLCIKVVDVIMCHEAMYTFYQRRQSNFKIYDDMSYQIRGATYRKVKHRELKAHALLGIREGIIALIITHAETLKSLNSQFAKVFKAYKGIEND